MLKWFVVSSVLITGCFSTHGVPGEHDPAHVGTREAPVPAPVGRSCSSELPSVETKCPPVDLLRYGWDGEHCVQNCHGNYDSMESCRRAKPACACPESLPEIGRECAANGKFCRYENACNSPTMLCDEGHWRVVSQNDGPCELETAGCERDPMFDWNQCHGVCDFGDGYAWDGTECRRTEDGCGGRFSTLEACESAHTQCMPPLCERTGGILVANGQWPNSASIGCCGFVIPKSSMGGEGLPFVCACTGDTMWDAERGCVPNACDCDREPTEIERCEQTGGFWRECVNCDDDGSCVCPAGTVEGSHGCERRKAVVAVPDSSCGRQQPCLFGAICCPAFAGNFCQLPICGPDGDVMCPPEVD